MNKDFWERIDRLEELAGKATQGKWNYCGCEIWANETGCSHDVIGKVEKFEDAQYIDAADPAMILEMIAEMKKLAKNSMTKKRISDDRPKESRFLRKIRSVCARRIVKRNAV